VDDGEEWQEEDQQSLVDVLLLVSYTEGRRPALQGDKNNDFALLVLVYKLKCYFVAAGAGTWYGVRLRVQICVRQI